MIEEIMPLDLQPTYIRRQQKDGADTRANIVQATGVALLAFLLSAILLVASAKYGVATSPDALIEYMY
jgi:hypothetical protein